MSVSVDSKSHFIRKDEFGLGSMAIQAATEEKGATVHYFIRHLLDTPVVSQEAIHNSGKEDRFRLEETIESINNLIDTDSSQVLDIMNGKVESPHKGYSFKKPGSSDGMSAQESARKLFKKTILNKHYLVPDEWALFRENYLLTFHPAPRSEALFNSVDTTKQRLALLAHQQQQEKASSEISNGKDKDSQ